KETCSFPDTEDLYLMMPVILAPAKGAKTGDRGTITYQAYADDLTPSAFTSTVTLVDGVDMVLLSGNGAPAKAKAKDKVGLPVVFMNTGNQGVTGFQITLYFDHALIPATYSNCSYGDDYRSHVVVCSFTDPADAVAPGEAVQLEDFGVT